MSPEATTPTPSSRQGRAPVAGVGRVGAPGFGTLWLAWSEVGLVEIGYEPFAWLDEAGVPLLAAPAEIAEALRAYFAGEPVDLATLPRDARGTAFQHRVWDALCRIPRGAVRTYAGIAADIGAPRAMRAVGMANGRNPLPIVVPCHRVIAASQRLGGYTGGLDKKRRLLALEGVRVEGDLVLPGQLSLFDRGPKE